MSGQMLHQEGLGVLKMQHLRSKSQTGGLLMMLLAANSANAAARGTGASDWSR